MANNIIDIVLDLETASLKPNAAIVQIGAYCNQTRVGFNHRISLASYPTVDSADKFHVDADTLDWWKLQPEDVRAYVFGGTDTIIDALKAFYRYVTSQAASHSVTFNGVRMWGNGAAFDNVILTNAYNSCGLKQPWSYRGDMCLRTLRNLARDSNLPINVDSVQPHNALYDAMAQAETLASILRVMTLPVGAP